MAKNHYDVAGVGNAIVDIIAECDDEFLIENKLKKGSMQLLDSNEITKLYRSINPVAQVSGGSAANTMVGIASFGGKAVYFGKVADDELGKTFTYDINSAGIVYNVKPFSGGASTARSIVLVTPDGERTMNTYLGISPKLESGDLNKEIIAASKILYLEGYLFDANLTKDTFYTAAKIAKRSERYVSLTLSDSSCVCRHREEFLEFIKSHVDILFANEDEINSLYQVEDFNVAAELVCCDVKFAALTRGEKGSIIISKEETVAIPPYAVEKVIDTTGAGDLYSAGFLFGFSNGLDLGLCGRFGSYAAGKVITDVGARPKVSLSEINKTEIIF
ncbi:MAG: putative sugar kinase YdjH [Hyphomicrobiaceae bacterium hypho_1]